MVIDFNNHVHLQRRLFSSAQTTREKCRSMCGAHTIKPETMNGRQQVNDRDSCHIASIIQCDLLLAHITRSFNKNCASFQLWVNRSHALPQQTITAAEIKLKHEQLK